MSESTQTLPFGQPIGASEPELKPISGPSAFGGSFRRFLNLLWVTTAQQYRLQYRTSLLGYFWTVLRPLTLFAVLYFVFTKVLNYGHGIDNYALTLLLGIMLYQFFADGTGTSLGALVRNEPTVRKMHFPRIVIPLAVVLSASITGFVNLCVSLVAIAFLGGTVSVTWLWVPLAFFALATLTTGVALLLCTAFVKVRDIGQIWSVIIRALFYATPILYPLDRVPAQYRDLVALNPLAPIFTQLRLWVFQPDSPNLIATIGWPALLGSVAITITICVLGVWTFTRQAPRVAELL